MTLGWTEWGGPLCAIRTGRQTADRTRWNSAEIPVQLAVSRRSAVTLISGAVLTWSRAAPAQENKDAKTVDAKVLIYVPATGSQPSREQTDVGLYRYEVAPSLAVAVARARELRTDRSARRQAVIELGPGIHRIDEAIRLTSADSGQDGSPFIIRGPAQGKARLRGSIRLVPVSSNQSNLARVPEASRPHVRVYQLPDQFRNTQRIDVSRTINQTPNLMPFEVFDDDGPLYPARWPKDGWAEGNQFKAGGGVAIRIAPDQTQKWRNEPDLWIGAYTNSNWAYETIPVARVDSKEHVLELARAPLFGFRPAFRVFIYHAIAELNGEGQWYRDQDNNQLIAWPRHSSGDEAAIEVSTAANLFTLEGISHCRLENLTLEMTRGDAIQVHGGSNVEITGCTIRLTGQHGVTFRNARLSGVSASRVESTGEGGVWLAGGDRLQLKPGQLFVTDTIIKNFSRLGRTYRPAVRLEGVGNRAIGNFISGSPHLAISFSGNDHLIELNEITDVLTDTTDAGAIYIGRDWTAQGTVIRHNYLHDLRAKTGFDIKGVYLDDFASGITIEGNLFLRVEQPIFVGGGRDNNVFRNVFLGPSPGIHIDGRGVTWAKNSIEDASSELRGAFRAMPVDSPIWVNRYPHLHFLMTDEPEIPKRNSANGNLFIGGIPYQLLPEVPIDKQNLQPVAVGANLRPISAHLLSLIAQVASASEIGLEFHEALKRATLSNLPFDRMDRRVRLYRR